jgi:hypothetical protein
MGPIYNQMQPVMGPHYYHILYNQWRGRDTTTDGAALQADAIIDGAAKQPDAIRDASLQPNVIIEGTTLQPDAIIEGAALLPYTVQPVMGPPLYNQMQS